MIYIYHFNAVYPCTCIVKESICVKGKLITDCFGFSRCIIFFNIIIILWVSLTNLLTDCYSLKLPLLMARMKPQIATLY